MVLGYAKNKSWVNRCKVKMTVDGVRVLMQNTMRGEFCTKGGKARILVGT